MKNLSRKWRTTSVVALSIFGVLTLGACSRKEVQEEPIKSVRVMVAGASEIQSQNQFSGTIQARIQSQLGFRIPGKIIARSVDAGVRVKAGQTLAQLDPQDVKLAEQAAAAQLSAARNALRLAQDNYDRFAALQKENFISSAELEKYLNMFRGAQAQYEQAKADASAKLNQLSYATLSADASGVITAVYAQVGQVVAAGSPVVVLAQDGPRDVVFSVPENLVQFLKIGMPISVKPWGGHVLLPAKVREIAASADASTRTFMVKATIEGKTIPELGSTVSVEMPRLGVSKTPAIKLPGSALFQNGASTAVWILDPKTHTVSKRDVELGTADENSAVVAKGVEAGDLVVTAGVSELHTGQRVNIYKDNNEESSLIIAPADGNAPSK